MLFPSAKIILFHPKNKNKVLLIKRTINDQIVYEPAGGKIEVDFKNKKAESLEECAIREAKEELGVSAKIDRYIGSYYFFWNLDPMKFSSCAVFVGTIISQDNLFKNNIDSCELPTEPQWINVKDILEKKIQFSQSYIGLQDLMIKHLKNLM